MSDFYFMHSILDADMFVFKLLYKWSWVEKWKQRQAKKKRVLPHFLKPPPFGQNKQKKIVQVSTQMSSHSVELSHENKYIFF